MKAESNIDKAAQLGEVLRELGNLLGILQDDAESFLKGNVETSGGLTDQQINELIARRNDAKANKNWAEADKIRKELKEQGVVLEDGAQGTSWRRG